MIKIEGIPIADVARLMSRVIFFGAHPVTNDTDEFMSTEISPVGVRIRYEHVGGPVWTRHYLRGKRWTVWIDLSSTTAFNSVSDETLWDPVKDETYFGLKAPTPGATEQIYRLKDYEFGGDYLDFHNDLTVMRVAGML